MTMRRLALPTVALSIMLAEPSSAAEKITRIDYFKLWNDCQSVELLVEGLHDDAAKIGLQVEDIETTIRSRLRSARLYEDRLLAAPTHLYANVNVTRRAFNVDMEYKRTVKVLSITVPADLAEIPFVSEAVTWDKGVVGTHGGSSGYILSVVARLTDKFIDEYLRVNREACEKRSPVR